MQQGMAYDYLSDPTGGQRMYENPMLSWGMIGVDIGLTLGHRKIAGAMAYSQESLLRHQLGMPRNMTTEQMRQKFAGSRHTRPTRAGTQGGPAGGWTSTGPSASVREARLKQTADRWFSRKATAAGVHPKMYDKYTGFRGLRGIGWFAAAVGLFDIGYSLFSEMARPGISREAQEKDKEMLSNSEGMLDTRMAFTQRQRAIQAIHDSQISIGRSMIGQESSYLHR